ncbi:DNA/RNA non-specific endonuclease [Popillia japonica]|uniref:DNA/RNA non-specific endonuclease n=1 Tax=Popillia japonica TaxID=7064 RepID=A0AAW1L6V8_POPJA
MELKVFAVIFVSIFVLSASTVRAACTISINRDLSDPQPLWRYYFISGGNGIDAENQLVDVACPGNSVLVDGVSIGAATGQARCSSTRFVISGKTVPFSSITCNSHATHTARLTGSSCLSSYQEAEIGFLVGSRFIRTMVLCWDRALQRTLYSQFTLTKTIAGYQSGYPRPSFIQGSGFFTATGIDNLYTQNTQRTTINGLLGLPAGSYQYIAQSGNYFLSRGHLTAKTDYLYGSQQRSTFYFINAIPQWQVINAYVWGTVEQNVRDLASRRSLDLTVYTGVHGVSTLPHATTGQQVELYLYVSGTARGIPVPRLTWKVVYNPLTRAGVAIITVNNPYVFDASKDVICTNICNQLTWTTFQQTNAAVGYSYCCSIPDFRRTVTSLPSFDVTQVLT